MNDVVTVFKTMLSNPDDLITEPFGTSLKFFPNDLAVYVIEFKNGSYYIGGSRYLKKRINQHRGNLRSGKHINKNMQTCYNLSSEVDILIHYAIAPDNFTLKHAEQTLLSALHGKLGCLNISDSSTNSTSGYDRTKAWERISQTKSKPEFRQKTAEQTKKNWQDTNFRNKVLDKIGEKVIVDNVEYLSVREASRATGYSIQGLRAALKDGVIFSKNVLPHKRRVIIKGIIFDTLEAASKHFGVADNTIHWRINNPKEKWSDHAYLD